MLQGGPDFRYLLPPAYSDVADSFGAVYWSSMAVAHGIEDNAADKQARWEHEYLHTGTGNVEFGILAQCGWLQDMWSAGNVAIVANVLGASSRNHPHSIMVMEHGDRGSRSNDYMRSGWGGRAAEIAGQNVLALTQIPRRFCYGSDPVNPDGPQR